MRVAFGLDIFYPETNGVITATINLANNLIDMGHEVYFFVPRDKKFEEPVIENGIHIVYIPAVQSFIYPGIKFSFKHQWSLKKRLRQLKIDVVHATDTWMICTSMSRAAKKLGLPIIATHHTLIDNPDYIQYALKSKRAADAAQKVVWKTLFSPFFKLVDVLTAPSETTCKHLLKHLPYPLDVRYVSNGIDVSRFLIEEPTHSMPEVIPPEFRTKNTIVFVGRQGYEKSIDILLKGFALLKNKRPEARLLIIGKGPAAEELKQLAQELNLGSTVCFTGVIPNDQLIGCHILKQTAAFASASLTENQPMTIIEALCSGSPAIVPDQPNMMELVSDDRGWIFQQNNIHDLAQKMELAITDADARERKAAATSSACELYDGRRVAKQFEEIYEEKLNERKTHAPAVK